MSKIILASASKARKSMLENAGIEFVVIPANIDEGEIIKLQKKENAGPENISLSLAKEKATLISKNNTDKYIVGSDQVLSMKDKIFSKAKNKEEAKKRLLELQGKEHFLTSSVCVAKEGKVIWHKTDTAGLKMKTMTPQAIDKYIEIAGSDVTDCVGCYAVEGVGARLFSDIKGDYFTIMGMPLLPLLNYLELEGALQ